MQGQILGSLRSDFLFLYAPSFVLTLAMMSGDRLWESPIIVLSVLVFLDMGHAYATLLRTYFRKEELGRTRAYAWLPVGIFLLMFTWSYGGFPYLWRFILYSTFYHHVRQNYGLFMWYAKNESFRPSMEKVHVHLMAFIPFILFHFRETEYSPLYHKSEFFSYGESTLTTFMSGLYTLYFFWILFTMFLKMQKKEVTPGLALSFIYPGALNYVSFLVFKNSIQAFIPLLAMHATTYLALISFSMKKLYPEKLSPLKIWGTVVLVVLFFVSIEYVVTDMFSVFRDPQNLRGEFLLSLIVAFSVLPNLMHYIIDAFIWTRGNPDFQKILSRS